MRPSGRRWLLSYSLDQRVHVDSNNTVWTNTTLDIVDGVLLQLVACSHFRSINKGQRMGTTTATTNSRAFDWPGLVMINGRYPPMTPPWLVQCALPLWMCCIIRRLNRIQSSLQDQRRTSNAARRRERINVSFLVTFYITIIRLSWVPVPNVKFESDPFSVSFVSCLTLLFFNSNKPTEDRSLSHQRRVVCLYPSLLSTVPLASYCIVQKGEKSAKRQSTERESESDLTMGFYQDHCLYLPAVRCLTVECAGSCVCYDFTWLTQLTYSLTFPFQRPQMAGWFLFSALLSSYNKVSESQQLLLLPPVTAVQCSM
jgi:hypothetical protein